MNEILIAIVAAVALLAFGKAAGKSAEKKKQWKRELDKFTADHEVKDKELTEDERVLDANLAEARNKLEEIEANEPTPIDSLDDAISRFNSGLSSESGDQD